MTTSPILYISYDGMLEPLGQSQVLTYLERLAQHRSIHLLSFEKVGDWADVEARARVQVRMELAGIHWHPRRYHKRPSALATMWDIAVGIVSGLWLALHHQLRIVHARSYVAALMALLITRATGAKFLFDMRGFWADERVDGELWPHDGCMYRVAKWLERRLLLAADHVVSLTNAGVREMEKFEYLKGRMPPVTVIPTCVDLERFQPRQVERQGLVLGYVGSAGTWYLFDEFVACFVELLRLRPDARLLIINRNEHDYIRARLDAGGISPDVVELRAASHPEVPAQMARMHATAFFIKPVFSKQASAPTKLGEFLGCGIPCLANHGVGDMASLLEDEKVGVAIEGFDRESIKAGVQRLLMLVAGSGVRERCRLAAKRHFSIEGGVSAYEGIYHVLDAES